MKRRLNGLLTALLVASVAAMMPTGAQANSQTMDKLTVLLDWFVNPDHAPLVVGKQAGIFAAHGLDIDLVAPADPNDPPKLAAAGKALLALTYQPQLQMQTARGLPLARVATLIATPLNSLMVLRDGPIHTIADLKGRKIGYSIGGFEDALLGKMLESAGLSLNDIKLVNVNFSLSPALLSGQVDAVIGAYRNFELNQMAIEGHPARAFYPEEHGVPAYDELVIVTNSKNLDNKIIGRFVDALEESVQFLLNHPDESWKMFIKAYPDLNDELNRRAWRDTLPRFALRPGAVDSQRYERFAGFLKDRGLIDRILPIKQYVRDVR